MRIWLIRHGATRATEEHRYQGRTDEELSARGRAELLRTSLACPRVYVSPARRARQTAEILFPQADQIVVPGLWEMDFGRFEGKSWQDMEEDADYRRWVDGGCLGQCPGGEDRASFSRRTCDAVDGILAGEAGLHRRCAGEKAEVIIVAHGGTQMALLEKRGSPAGAYFSWQTPCGCGWLLEAKADTGILKVVKKVRFLKS